MTEQNLIEELDIHSKDPINAEPKIENLINDGFITSEQQVKSYIWQNKNI